MNQGSFFRGGGRTEAVAYLLAAPALGATTARVPALSPGPCRVAGGAGDAARAGPDIRHHADRAGLKGDDPGVVEADARTAVRAIADGGVWYVYC